MRRIHFSAFCCVVIVFVLTQRSMLDLFWEKRGLIRDFLKGIIRHDPSHFNPASSSKFSKFRSKVGPVNCAALNYGDKQELKRAERYMASNPRSIETAKELTKKARDCQAFRRDREYDVFPVSNEERNFPIAFSILMHRDPGQVERLLRIIYRSHNFYCIHSDAKSDNETLEAIASISACFPNVFVPSELVEVTYAHFSRLRADLTCMKELVVHGVRWKYLINLTGQMFPLKTNLEIVRTLKNLNGTNDIENLSLDNMTWIERRYKYKWKTVNGTLVKTREKQKPPPHNITLVKSITYGSFTREFVEYILHDRIVQDFLNWCSDVHSPDEFFFSTVNCRHSNPVFRSPGGHTSAEEVDYLSTYVRWRNDGLPCGGKFVRSCCVFGVSDLQHLLTNGFLFANKFYADFQYLAMDCIEEWLWNRTLTLSTDEST